jgi:hypothetical protein
MEKAFLVCALIVLVSLNVLGIALAEEQKWCPLCSMDLKMFWRSSHWLTFADGTRTGYCSIHCACQVYGERPAHIDHWEAVGHDTQKLIDARTAPFLIGSSLPGTMTAVSKVAFASVEAAKGYQQQHGGQIGTFDDALKRSLDDLGSDKALIVQRVAKMTELGKGLAAKHGCYSCHGKDGTGGKAKAWNTVEFFRKMDSRVKIKNAITEGTPAMEGYGGNIPGQELHAITVYVWSQRPQ